MIKINKQSKGGVIKSKNINNKNRFSVEFIKVEKNFLDNNKKIPILKGLSFRIEKGEVSAILGSSGGGKTTTARIINGLTTYDGGKVYVNGELLTKKNQAKIRKQTAFVFQNFNLFPHMSVLENITYAPIHVYKQNKEDVLAKGKKLLKQFLIDKKAECLPHELSGGQKQRVAIIRALMLDPKILIMDEPTASLDPELTHDVIEMIKTLHKSGLSIIIITHDIVVAKKATNKIIMMHSGRCVDMMNTEDFFNKKKKKHFYSERFLQNCE